MDYEAEPPADIANAYAAERDPFDATLSPRLPPASTSALQLFWQEQPHRRPGRRRRRPCSGRSTGPGGSAARRRRRSDQPRLPHRPLAARRRRLLRLAERRGWARGSRPSRRAGETGRGAARVAAATGIRPDCPVLCGLHDSNASLNAARGFPEVAGAPFSLISTGTWFVTFQSGGGGRRASIRTRDTLANVDVEGRPVPSARFMGGREYAACRRGRQRLAEPRAARRVDPPPSPRRPFPADGRRRRVDRAARAAPPRCTA